LSIKIDKKGINFCFICDMILSMVTILYMFQMSNFTNMIYS